MKGPYHFQLYNPKQFSKVLATDLYEISMISLLTV